MDASADRAHYTDGTVIQDPEIRSYIEPHRVQIGHNGNEPEDSQAWLNDYCTGSNQNTNAKAIPCRI